MSVLLNRLRAVVTELRGVGLPISLVEEIDAVRAAGCCDLTDRESLKEALACSLVKAAEHRAVFDTVFEIYFASVPADEHEEEHDETHRKPVPDDLTETVRRVLAEDEEPLALVLAKEAVTRFAGMVPGRPAGVNLYALRAVRPLHLEENARLVGDDLVRGAEAGMAFAADIARRRVEERRRRLVQEIEAEVRRRLVADRGAAAVTRTLRLSLPEDVDFARATQGQLEAMGRAVEPLTRRLARKLARDRIRHRGPVDMRATLRHSMATGGVPVDLRYRPPRPRRPEVVLVADVSGSVASFADFTLQLVYSMSQHFTRIRAFVFVDGVSEVTETLRESRGLSEALERVSESTEAVWGDGRSDYGNALSLFSERWGGEIGSRTTVLVLGDARNNFRAPQERALRSIARRADHLYWLNPEPVRYWNSGDSLADEYGRHCAAMVECRNLRQLEEFIESVL
ncbi:VWA domain-containing protein [Nocardiopsis oceani]